MASRHIATVHRRRTATAVLAAAVFAGIAGVGLPATAAAAPGSEMIASAYGYYTNVSLFGGPKSTRGPAPTVTLAPDAANSPRDASLPSAVAQYGPAQVFKSGALDVHAEGSSGASGSVSAAADIKAVANKSDRPGPFVYDEVKATCGADGSGVHATTTITGGGVQTVYDATTQEPTKTVPVPTNPPEGFAVPGSISYIGDHFRVVFNEQKTNSDGSITVNAVHIYLLGAIAVGDVIIGELRCGYPKGSAPGGVAGSTPSASPSVASASPTPSATPSEASVPPSTPSASPTQSASAATALDHNDTRPVAASSGLSGGALAGIIVVALVALGLAGWGTLRWRAKSGGEGM